MGKRWAVLVAGSNTYWNYRHQADVCHAYQILKKGGLKDENIIVFMYDDVAFAKENPMPGIIINKAYGPDVYYGVPKDYTGQNATVHNLLAVILGNRSALIGGSMFDGLLPNNWNIYAITAANPEENSYGFYCDFGFPFSPEEYETCLGDLFSISWLEDSDKYDMSQETLQQQYEAVKRRTGFDTPRLRSHVMHYGDKSLSNQLLYTYLGTNPENKNRTITDQSLSLTEKIRAVNQRDIELVYLRRKFENAPKGSQQKIEAEKKLNKEISQRKYVDGSINLIATSLFGQKDGLHLLEYVRPAGQPLVDDWDCLKMFVKIYEEKCGVLTTYGKKYARPMANMCNFGINEEQMIVASTKACSN
ncbi:hypothetical protein QYF36_016379 [Acer negundo]|nr:hypothetical protein QYF36_016379 [Acer negundo]